MRTEKDACSHEAASYYSSQEKKEVEATVSASYTKSPQHSAKGCRNADNVV